MLRKLLLTIASIFLIWQSYKLLTQIHHFQSNSWTNSLFLGAIINLFITGIFAFAGFAWPTERILSPNYYLVQNPDRLKNIYKLLRVDLFRKFLLATVWKSKAQQAKHFNGKKNGLDMLIEQANKSEFGHLIPFFLITFVCCYFIWMGYYKLTILTFVINIIFNFYPVLLQRHHRIRVQRIRNRQ